MARDVIDDSTSLDQATSLVVAVAQRVLGDADVDPDTVLVFAGLDSTTAVDISHELGLASGLQLSEERVMEHQTPRSIAAFVIEQLLADGEANRAAPPIEAIAELTPLAEAPHQPFPLTPIQESYVCGRYEESPSCPCQVRTCLVPKDTALGATLSLC